MGLSAWRKKEKRPVMIHAAPPGGKECRGRGTSRILGEGRERREERGGGGSSNAKPDGEIPRALANIYGDCKGGQKKKKTKGRLPIWL